MFVDIHLKVLKETVPVKNISKDKQFEAHNYVFQCMFICPSYCNVNTHLLTHISQSLPPTEKDGFCPAEP